MMLKHLAKLSSQDHSVVRTTVYHHQCYSVLCTMSRSQVKNRQHCHMLEEASKGKEQFSTSALSFFPQKKDYRLVLFLYHFDSLCFKCVGTKYFWCIPSTIAPTMMTSTLSQVKISLPETLKYFRFGDFFCTYLICEEWAPTLNKAVFIFAMHTIQ